MLNTAFKEFQARAARGGIVPVCAEYLADMETPVSVLQRFCRDENVFLLESVEGGERAARFSFLGVNPRGVFTIIDGKPYYTEDGIRRELPMPASGCALDALREILGNRTFVETDDIPPLPGGAVGMLGYEAVALFEDVPVKTAETPTAALMICDEMIAFDNVRRTIQIIICVHPDEFGTLEEAYADAQVREEYLAARIRIPTGIRGGSLLSVPHETTPPPVLESNMKRHEFCEMVERGRKLIQDGECIQLVLSQRFSAPQNAPALEIYRRLRLVNPSPYMFFLKLGTATLVGSSPETMVKLVRRRSSLKPIAGTRPRGKTVAEDIALADELLRDEKERAEHLMLVDLGRNDLGRTAFPGSVHVREFMKVERYSHVMHLVSEVEAELNESCDALDLLRTTFPAGTLSGAPKIRAMELIDQLEPTPRGVYGGTVGYLSYNGNMDMAITIRTMEIRDSRIHIQAGAGIVFDSVPETEYQETLNKAAALLSVVAQGGEK